jgi:hypothetical protein
MGLKSIGRVLKTALDPLNITGINSPSRRSGGEPLSTSSDVIGQPEWLYSLFEEDKDIDMLMSQAKERFHEPMPETPKFQERYAQDFMSAGRKEADIAAGGVRNSLAARGAGGLAGGLSLGAQARSGSVMDAISRGAQADIQKYGQDISLYGTQLSARGQQFDIFQAQKQNLMNALTFKYNILNQIMGGHLGQVQTQLQYVASKEQTDAGLEASKWQSVMGVFGSIFDKGG